MSRIFYNFFNLIIETAHIIKKREGKRNILTFFACPKKIMFISCLPKKRTKRRTPHCFFIRNFSALVQRGRQLGQKSSPQTASPHLSYLYQPVTDRHALSLRLPDRAFVRQKSIFSVPSGHKRTCAIPSYRQHFSCHFVPVFAQAFFTGPYSIT